MSKGPFRHLHASLPNLGTGVAHGSVPPVLPAIQKTDDRGAGISCKPGFCLSSVWKWMLLFGLCLSSFALILPAQDSVFREQIEPILSEYCYDCHGDGMNRGQLSLDTFASDADRLAQKDLWVAVLKNVRTGVMPPEKRPRPTESEWTQIENWILQRVFLHDPAQPDPGRVTLRRLNRSEYRNTINDLMGYDFRADDEFPADDTGYGFDTIGDVLTVSPMLLEKYLMAAETIVAAAVPTEPRQLKEVRFPGRGFSASNASEPVDTLQFTEPICVQQVLEVDTEGEYELELRLAVRAAFDFNPARAHVRVRLGNEMLWDKEVGWGDRGVLPIRTRGHWTEGSQVLSVQVIPKTPSGDSKAGLTFRLEGGTIRGPMDPEHWVAAPNYDRFFSEPEPPADAAGRKAYATRILERFALRAFRRPPDPDTLRRLVEFAELNYSQTGRRFEEGVARAFVAVLASPRFLFRVEDDLYARQHGGDVPVVPLDEYALASRLSYFLWLTMPDDTLFRLAEQGRLRQNLPNQVQRMTRDRQFQAFVTSFVGQWMQVRDLSGIPIDGRAVVRREGRNERYLFTPEIRQAMRAEAENYFTYIVRNDRPLSEFLDSDYTFLNRTLAAHYGLPEVKSERVTRVSLPPGSPRGGILTQGAILAVTSNPTRTSPVKRGQYILDNILGIPTPPPPPDIPDLESAAQSVAGREPSVRELMQIHREQPLCRSCHSRMDPLGLALENFNAMGMWREQEFGNPLDASGELFTGDHFQDVRQLKRALVEKHLRSFHTCLTEKLLTYALGRGLEYYDVPTVDAIVDRIEKEEGRFSALLMGIVESPAFLNRRNMEVWTQPNP